MINELIYGGFSSATKTSGAVLCINARLQSCRKTAPNDFSFQLPSPSCHSVGGAFGPPKEMKNAASFGNCPFLTTTLSFLSFRAQTACPGLPWRNLLCAFRVPHIYRSKPLSRLSSSRL
jgi:hypothetical protein